MVIFVIYISAFSSFISSAEGKRRSSTQAKRKLNDLKGQKFLEAARPERAEALSPGHRPGCLWTQTCRPVRAKAFNTKQLTKFLPLQAPCWLPLYPGRCPGLRASALSGRAASMSFCPLPLLYPSASEFQFRYAPVTVGSGRVGLTCETCIYKISYQILFGFTVEYVLVREKFFLWKKCQSIIFWQNVEINSWLIIR